MRARGRGRTPNEERRPGRGGDLNNRSKQPLQNNQSPRRDQGRPLSQAKLRAAASLYSPRKPL